MMREGSRLRSGRRPSTHAVKSISGGRRQGGFTLLELVLVIFFLGIVAAMAFPTLQSLSRNDMSLTVRHLSKTIVHLADQSAATKQIYRLNYDLDSQEYWASVRKGENFVPVQSAYLKRVALPDTVSFKDILTLRGGKVIRGEAHTDFYPVGRVERTVFHLVDEDGANLTLFVNPLTGRIKIFDGYREEVRDSRS